MRIAMISHGSGPYGAERVLAALADGLAGRGHEVLLDFPHPGTAVEGARPAEVEVRVGRRHRLPRNGMEAAAWLASAPPAVRDVKRAVRSFEPDLVWVNSLYNPWAALAGAGGPPVVWHLHEYRLPEPLGLAMAALAGATADRIVVVSSFLADGWRRYPWLRGKTSVLPNPLLPDLKAAGQRAREPDGPFTVGYLGQLEPRKRVPDLVRALADVPDARGVIVGDGKAREATESAIRELELQDRVEMTGFRADIAAELARFHCMVIPSVREPFGLVALEAMDAGVPVVAARSGALPEVLGPAALYFEPGEIREMAARIQRLKAEPTLRRELAERGLERVAAFRPEPWLDGAERIARDVAGLTEEQ